MYSKCLLHENAEHWTSDCKFYLSKPREVRMKMLKEKGACWSCLKGGHCLPDCRRKKVCDENGCTEKHYETLHKEKQGVSVSAASVCSNMASDTHLLQLQKIKTKKGWANVMWDNAASLCSITNTKAKAKKLCGMRKSFPKRTSYRSLICKDKSSSLKYKELRR